MGLFLIAMRRQGARQAVDRYGKAGRGLEGPARLGFVAVGLLLVTFGILAAVGLVYLGHRTP